ncbi:hypothetical protein DYB37_010587 [Aphanomyces astaci]|uniref:Uncharacterized protein n=1 Tax=Aphanomyces astaci TaxID=112090 RepID=A0A3R7E2R2_APHAT|nr:hypothetical protein DYB35_009159 [Aphanomyces astaci]RHZ22139.1 hypothetical protein DYB37_010587 [Aphanomyces astaci]
MPLGSLPRRRRKRTLTQRVQFTTATTYLFDVAYGGSAVPIDSGPPIGLARRHCDSTDTDLTQCLDLTASYGTVRKFDHVERIALLKAAAYPVKEITDFCFDAIDVRKSRLDTVEDFKRKRHRRDAEARRQRRCLDGACSSDDDDTLDDES